MWEFLSELDWRGPRLFFWTKRVLDTLEQPMVWVNVFTGEIRKG